jgi:hypothetical protein
MNKNKSVSGSVGGGPMNQVADDGESKSQPCETRPAASTGYQKHHLIDELSLAPSHQQVNPFVSGDLSSKDATNGGNPDPRFAIFSNDILLKKQGTNL